MCSALFVGGCSAIFYLFSEPLPSIEIDQKKQARAEALIDTMWTALNAPAWFAAEGAEWTFRNDRHYVWHKHLGRVKVDLSETLTVYLDISTSRGRAFERGQALDRTAGTAHVARAIKAFNNDSFWLAAPFKARDPGTQRSLVTDESGEGVLVYYTSGGSTPGDRYLWRFSTNHHPKLWQLWVHIIPVKGVRFTWEDWRRTTSGALISHLHQSKVLNVYLQDVKVVSHFDELEVNDAYLTSAEWSHLMGGIASPTSPHD